MTVSHVGVGAVHGWSILDPTPDPTLTPCPDRRRGRPRVPVGSLDDRTVDDRSPDEKTGNGNGIDSEESEESRNEKEVLKQKTEILVGIKKI